MNLYEYQRSRSFIDHWSKVTQIQYFQTSFPEKPLGGLKPNFMWSLSGMANGPDHMTKMAAMPIYGKNMKNSSSSEPKG